MRKLSNTLIYLGVITLLIAALTLLCHFREVGRVLYILSCVLLLLGIIMLPFRAKNTLKQANYYTSPGLNRMLQGYKLSVWAGFALIIIGAILKLLHLDKERYVSLAGISIFLFAFILMLIINFSKKRYVAPIPNVDIDPGDLDRYIGIYSNEQLKMDITVSKNGGSLSAQATGQSAFPLSPVKENIFNYIRAGIVMEFHPEKKEFILIQRGGYFPFTKQ